MIFKDQYDSSFWNKSVFSGCILLTLFATLWLLFADYAISNTWLRQYQLSGDPVRRTLIAFCLIIYFVRLQVTVWVFQKRKWTWLETITITVLMSVKLILANSIFLLILAVSFTTPSVLSTNIYIIVYYKY